jgi:hypothetical protein
MITPEASLKGSRTANEKKRRLAREKYEANPNHCQECGQVIELRLGEKPTDARHRKFCSMSCAATHNGQRRHRKAWSEEARKRLSDRLTNGNGPKRKKGKLVVESSGKCESCGAVVIYAPYKGTGRKSPRYWQRFYCDGCVNCMRSESRRVNGFMTPYPWDTLSKKELRDLMDGNAYQFKSRVTGHARRVYEKEHGHAKCVRCDFPAITVSHKRAVADFPDDALIKDINAPDNLLGLCPNCHWMWDKGYLTEENFHLSNDEILKSVGA